MSTGAGRHGAVAAALGATVALAIYYQHRTGQGQFVRTSMIAAMLQTLAGMPVTDILDDYELDLRTRNDEALTEAALDLHCADACLAMVAFLGSTDVAAYLTASGLTFEQLDHLRARLTTA